MTSATLYAHRLGDSQLQFMLHSSEQGAPIVMEAKTILSTDQLGNLLSAYKDFARCLAGFDDDEPKFRNLGMVLYAMVLPNAIKAHLRQSDEALTIITDDPALPWEIMHDGREYLSLRVATARKLIFREQMAGFLRPTMSQEDEGFASLVIADPTCDLPGAKDEGRAIAGLLSQRGPCDLLVGEEAGFQEIACKLVSRSYSLIHFCGHVGYDCKGRRSFIRLSKKRRLFAEEALSMVRGRPVVFLNACYSDRQVKPSASAKSSASQAQANSARSESFAQAFMLGNESGVASAVVGTMWGIPDEPAEAGREFCLGFYAHLLGGGSVGEALRLSRAMAKDKQWGPMVWGPYVLYGDPCLEPFKLSRAPAGVVDTGRDAVSVTTGSGEIDNTAQPPADIESVEEPKSESGLTLDSVARRAFHVALQEMKQLDQGVLCSIHLLIGLCEAGVGVLQDALRQRGLDCAAICESARTRVKEIVPRSHEGFGITQNIAAMLLNAADRAKQFENPTVGGEDLLAALLLREDAEAIAILERFGISKQALIGKLPQPPPTPSGPPDLLRRFSPQASEAVKHAMERAQEAHLDFVGTPHLLVGLVETGSLDAVVLLREHHVNLPKLCKYLLQGVGGGTGPNGNGASRKGIRITERADAILRRARQLAGADPGAEVDERDLLQAILEQDGFTAQVLQAMGAAPDVMLSALLRTKGQ